MKKTNENKMTVAEIVTARIIEKLEAGVIPWYKPWQGGEAVNYVTQKPYRGINRLLLDGGEYLTFKQVQECGGRVKKGAKSHMVAFYNDYTKEEEDEDGNKVEKIIKVLRYYNVFALSDCSGLDSKIVMEQRKNYTIEECEEITGGYIHSDIYYTIHSDLLYLYVVIPVFSLYLYYTGKSAFLQIPEVTSYYPIRAYFVKGE